MADLNAMLAATVTGEGEKRERSCDRQTDRQTEGRDRQTGRQTDRSHRVRLHSAVYTVQYTQADRQTDRGEGGARQMGHDREGGISLRQFGGQTDGRKGGRTEGREGGRDLSGPTLLLLPWERGRVYSYSGGRSEEAFTPSDPPVNIWRGWGRAL
jgi:hypothetical protein